MNYIPVFLFTFLLLPLHAMDTDSLKEAALEQELSLLEKQETKDTVATLLSWGSMVISAARGHKSLTVATTIPCTYFIGKKTFERNDKKEKLELAIEQLKSLKSNQEKN